MPDTDINIREFKSPNDFRAWWTSSEVEEFCRRHPEKISQLRAHQWVSPWLFQETVADDESIKPPEGNIFGKYTIEKKLGQGGMGAVYLAHDPDLNRKVALKLMLLKEPGSVERFSREARASAKLKHPNIIQVYEIGSIEERHYFTMDYIDGESLDGLIARADGHLSPRRTARIIRDIALALDYAHKQGIIHRDIKPANILIDKDDKVYLTDFGLAKELSGTEHSLTMTGTIMGTADYMSPEQAMALKSGIDHRTDVFSLGATLYHALTGQMPFKGGELYQILESVVRQDPVAPSRLVNRLSKDIETICLKCLEKEPVGRYQSAGELAEDLNHFLNGEAISARPVSLLVKLQKKAKKNKIAFLALTAVLVLLIAGAAAITVSYARQQTVLKAKNILDKIKIGKPKPDDKIAMANDALKIDPFMADAWEVIGDAYVCKNDYKKAIVAFSKAIELNPALVFAYYGRGYSIENGNNPQNAIPDYQKVIELAPDSDMGYVAMGIIKSLNLEYESAIKYFDKAIKTKADSLPAYERRAVCYIHTGRPDLALADWSKAIELGTNHTGVYSSRGFFYLKKGDYVRAISDYTRAIELDTDSSDMYYHGRGFAYAKKGEIDKALADLNKAVELNPGNPEHFNERGLIYLDNKGEFDKAIADFTKAIELKPKNAYSYDNRGMAYVFKYEIDPALADFNRAIELDGTSAVLYKHRGMAYYDKKELELALADITKAIKLDPKDAESYRNRSSLYRDKSEPDKALADLNEAINLNPKDDTAFNNRGLIYLYNKGEVEEAITDFDKAIALNNKSAKAYHNRGLAHKRQRKFNLALADFSRSIELSVDNPAVLEESYLCRGETYYQINKLDLAIDDYTQVIKINPKSVTAYNNRGFIYDAKKDYSRALADYGIALDIKPDDAEVYFNRSYSYAAQGKYKEAIADAEMFLNLAPDHPKTREIKRHMDVWKTMVKTQK